MTSQDSTTVKLARYRELAGKAKSELTAANAALLAATGRDIPAAARRVARATEAKRQADALVAELGG